MDHLPLYRQIQSFKREKIPIASSTLEGWARQSLKLIDILYKQLLDDTKSKGYLQADETPIKVLDKNKKGRTHQGYYWVYHNPIDKTVFFDYYQPGRSAKAARMYWMDLRDIFKPMGMLYMIKSESEKVLLI